MNLTKRARLRRRWRIANSRLDLQARDLAATIVWWRAACARHRVAVAVIGGGLGGIALTTLPLRVLPRLVGKFLRAAALFAAMRARAPASPIQLWFVQTERLWCSCRADRTMRTAR
jgi:hypothetical protein